MEETVVNLVRQRKHELATYRQRFVSLVADTQVLAAYETKVEAPYVTVLETFQRRLLESVKNVHVAPSKVVELKAEQNELNEQAALLKLRVAQCSLRMGELEQRLRESIESRARFLEKNRTAQYEVIAAGSRTQRLAAAAERQAMEQLLQDFHRSDTATEGEEGTFVEDLARLLRAEQKKESPPLPPSLPPATDPSPASPIGPLPARQSAGAENQPARHKDLKRKTSRILASIFGGS